MGVVDCKTIITNSNEIQYLLNHDLTKETRDQLSALDKRYLTIKRQSKAVIEKFPQRVGQW